MNKGCLCRLRPWSGAPRHHKQAGSHRVSWSFTGSFTEKTGTHPTNCRVDQMARRAYKYLLWELCIRPGRLTFDLPAPAAPTVMAGLDPAIYRGTALGYDPRQGAATDGRVKPGHDGWSGRCTSSVSRALCGLVKPLRNSVRTRLLPCCDAVRRGSRDSIWPATGIVSDSADVGQCCAASPMRSVPGSARHRPGTNRSATC